MTTYLPTLKQLQYLIALADHGHFGRAADACFVTQSTLSAGLRELESLIGITLVERTRRVVRFTPLGLNPRRVVAVLLWALVYWPLSALVFRSLYGALAGRLVVRR